MYIPFNARIKAELYDIHLENESGELIWPASKS